MTQRILYFTAAALFLIAGVLSAVNDGISLRAGLGLLTAGIMVWLGSTTKGRVN